MRASHVGLTLVKELRETLRDRRTLAVMMLFPLVVYPLLSLVVSQVVVTREKKREARPATVAIAGAGPTAEDLRRRVRAVPKTFALVETATAADVEKGRIDALLLVPPDGSPGRRVEVIYDAARDESRAAADRLHELVADALPEGCERIDVARRDLASKTRLGGYLLAKVLPIAIVLMVLLGAFYPAIDVTAGERERGTLETLLSAPIERFDLLLGKVLAVAAIAALTGLLNLGSMTVTLIHAVHIADGQAALPVPWGRAAASALVIVPAALLFSALFVMVGSVARGFKEAQNLLMPVYFMAIAPALVGAVGEFPLRGAAALVPAMNVTLLARDLVLGEVAVLPALIALASTVLYAAAALALAARLYDSEQLVHPQELRRADEGARDGTAPPDDPPRAGEALALFAIGFVLLYFVFVPWQQRHLVSGLLAAQYLGMLGLVVGLAAIRRRNFAAMVALRRPSGDAILGAVLVGASAWAAVALLSEWLVPVPPEVIEHLRRVLVTDQRPFLLNLLLIALTPALCEEALFRGVVLRGLATRVPAAAAAVVTGLLFGLFHLDVYRLLPSSVLGVLLSVLALRSGSIVPAVVAHFVNNALLLSLASARVDERLAALPRGIGVGLFVASVVLTALGLRLARRAGPGGGV